MEEYDIVIVGAGPSGLTAGIYTGREGLKSLIIEKGVIGGNANTAPVILNYPGFKSIPGLELLNKIGEQAEKYIEISENEELQDIIKTDNKFFLTTNQSEYSAKVIIFSSGTTYRKLGVKGEKEFVGKGISYCSICDGMLFKDRDVIVVGGGNSAAEHALHLNDIGVNVTIIHRRDELRAQQYLKDKLMEKGIPILWNTVLTEIKGDMFLKSVNIHNRETDVDEELKDFVKVVEQCFERRLSNRVFLFQERPLTIPRQCILGSQTSDSLMNPIHNRSAGQSYPGTGH